MTAARAQAVAGAGFRPTGRQQTYRRPDGSAFGERELALDLAR